MALFKTKLEKLQAEATELGIEFTQDATIVELEEAIEAKKAPAEEAPEAPAEEAPEAPAEEAPEAPAEEAPATEEKKEEEAPAESRKTEKVEPVKVKTNEEKIADVKKGLFMVFDMNGKMTQAVESEEEAQSTATAIDGRYEEKE